MGEITLVLGGTRSGKSEFAEKLAANFDRVAFVATAQALDDDMQARIRRQRERRPAKWRTFEQPLGLDLLLKQAGDRFDLILVDCACLYVMNLLLTEDQEANKEGYVLREIGKFCKACREVKAEVLVVSSQVGCGVPPTSRLDRQYRDIVGLVNQQLAACADVVYHVVAGLPSKLKEEKDAEP